MLPIKDTLPAHRVPVCTWLLIAANTIVFLFELAVPKEQLADFFYIFGVVPARYHVAGFDPGAVYLYLPVLTGMFLHGGFWHLLGNMWALWIFGSRVEDRLGSFRFLVFYLLSGLVANFTHILLNANSTVPAVGASGAIAGVMGAYLFMFPTSTLIVVVPIFFWPFFFELPAVFYLILWFVMQFFGAAYSAMLPGEVGGIAWWAHVGVFIFGMLAWPLFQRPQRRFEWHPLDTGRAWRRPQW